MEFCDHCLNIGSIIVRQPDGVRPHLLKDRRTSLGGDLRKITLRRASTINQAGALRGDRRRWGDAGAPMIVRQSGCPFTRADPEAAVQQGEQGRSWLPRRDTPPREGATFRGAGSAPPADAQCKAGPSKQPEMRHKMPEASGSAGWAGVVREYQEASTEPKVPQACRIPDRGNLPRRMDPRFAAIC